MFSCCYNTSHSSGLANLILLPDVVLEPIVRIPMSKGNSNQLVATWESCYDLVDLVFQPRPYLGHANTVTHCS